MVAAMVEATAAGAIEGRASSHGRCKLPPTLSVIIPAAYTQDNKTRPACRPPRCFLRFSESGSRRD